MDRHARQQQRGQQDEEEDERGEDSPLGGGRHQPALQHEHVAVSHDADGEEPVADVDEEGEEHQEVAGPELLDDGDAEDVAGEVGEAVGDAEAGVEDDEPVQEGGELLAEDEVDEVTVGGEDHGHGGPGDGLHVGGHVAREHVLGRVQVQHVPHVAQAGVLPHVRHGEVHPSGHVSVALPDCKCGISFSALHSWYLCSSSGSGSGSHVCCFPPHLAVVVALSRNFYFTSILASRKSCICKI